MSHSAAIRLLRTLCGLPVLACAHFAPADVLPADPAEAAQSLDRDLLLLVDGATTLHAEVQGVKIETRIALTPTESEATWVRAVAAFDTVQPHLPLSAHDQLALEYRFALLHAVLDDDAGSERAADLHADLSPHLSRLAPSDLASR